MGGLFAGLGFFVFGISILGLFLKRFRGSARRGVVIGVGLFVAGFVLEPGDPEARAAAAAERARVEAEEARVRAAEAAEERRRGFHCLSAWDGSHRAFREHVKAAMRNPGSFEHSETLITPVDEDGLHFLIMHYRAQNGFGGMNAGIARAEIDNADCGYRVLGYE